ncbi:hypothetical protein P7C73_g5182, partial [Tremellales sp. Uapishka_1]
MLVAILSSSKLLPVEVEVRVELTESWSDLEFLRQPDDPPRTMSSPPPTHLLLDPVTELSTSLSLNAFGLKTYVVLTDQSYPFTDADKATVLQDAMQTGAVAKEIRAKGRIEVLEGGEVGLELDMRGWTIESATGAPSPYLGKTYESLEAMLIEISPGYMEAMQLEVMRRFEGLREEMDAVESAPPDTQGE